MLLWWLISCAVVKHKTLEIRPCLSSFYVEHFMVAQKLEHATVNKPHALFLGELPLGFLLDLVVSILLLDRRQEP